MKEFKRTRGAESQERINDSDSSEGVEQVPMEIQRDITFTVQSESVDRSSRGGGAGSAAGGRWEPNNVTTVVSTVR